MYVLLIVHLATDVQAKLNQALFLLVCSLAVPLGVAFMIIANESDQVS